MGDLAVRLGFYGADWSGGDASLGEAGEALTVIDPAEAWVFHVLADDSGTSAIWVDSPPSSRPCQRTLL